MTISTIIAIAEGVVIVSGIAWAWIERRAWQDVVDGIEAGHHRTWRMLCDLRDTCFLTDTDGVRRRYWTVAPEVRERAEG